MSGLRFVEPLHFDVMGEPAWSELLRLSEESAWRRRLETLQLGQLRWVVGLTTVAAIAPLISLLTARRYLGASGWGVLLGTNLVMLLMRDRSAFRQQIGMLQLAQLVLLVIAMALSAPEPMVVWAVSVLVLSLIALILMRWRDSHLWTLAAVLYTAAVWDAFREGAPGRLPQLIVGAGIIALAATVSMKWTRRIRERFLGQYRRLAGAEKDRVRMRGELDDARTVQLSMLPQRPPNVSWLDIASVSIPATEVGGDYYDYIELDSDRVALVVGDVSGHGMASGLVLAGVRTGLHLLREELERPVEVLRRLDRAIRDTSHRRMLVTLQIAVVDRRRNEIIVANAGHPPLIVASGSGGRELGAPGPPLGTRLESEYVEQRSDFSAGDRLLLYTDGVTELANFRGDPFGADRLVGDIAKVPSEQGSRALLDALLSTLTHFKADTEQEDDLTLIVVGLGE